MHQATDSPADSHLNNETADMAPGYAPLTRHYYVTPELKHTHTHLLASGNRTFFPVSIRLHHKAIGRARNSLIQRVLPSNPRLYYGRIGLGRCICHYKEHGLSTAELLCR